jgi:hypothetical protein
MVNRTLPEVGQWYAHRDKGQMFQVVAFDEDDGLIELQDFDGDVDEVDLDTWRAMPLDPAEPPEDWSGPVDDVDAEDLGYAERDLQARDWRAPLDGLPAAPQDLAEPDLDDEDANAR